MMLAQGMLSATLSLSIVRAAAWDTYSCDHIDYLLRRRPSHERRLPALCVIRFCSQILSRRKCNLQVLWSLAGLMDTDY
ncbi:hypothetical protein BD626DRAFT_494492 [Schizophyllum amplum]|uniref:Secreted protein n=1 Tax=Schizophyllum amplum TaxID=97359 RepID=A0A550CFA5_9AGAR|nr:hypothetical protein BD626DRAFT_494492 [Auriculariopsis ampla]